MKVIGLTYGGKEYTINEDEVFLTCDAIEDVITLGEMAQMMQDTSKIKFAKLAAAYAALLREAGANVTAKQMHAEFRKALGGEAKDGVIKAQEALAQLINILMDGADTPTGDKEPGNGQGS